MVNKVKLTAQGKGALALATAAVAGVTLWKTGLLAKPRVTDASSVPARVSLPRATAATGATTGMAVTMPGATPVAGGRDVRALVFAWNSQMGWMFANGGPVTTEGSLMASRGLRLTLRRQDDTSVMAQELAACARELAAGDDDCRAGAHFVAVMGDGAAPFLRGLNAALARLGPDLTAEIVGSAGYSRGEDKFMGPPAWRDDPQSARGGLVAGVLRDGDWNLAMFWAANNGLCNNPDPATWDADCLNWVGTTSYLEPVEKYNQAACETRPVVSAGRPTGRTQRVCVQGVVTWTPGDVNVVRGPRGGLVSILSTADGENANQMPNAIIGLRRWDRAHRAAVTGMLEAIGLGGEAVNSDPRALSLAARVSDAVYAESGTGPMYWETYFRGREEADRVTGQRVALGGSKANNLADMLHLFGLAPGSANVFEATYTAFGNVARQQYPREVPDFPAFAAVADTSYLLDASRRLASAAGAPALRAFDPRASEAARPVMRRAWTVTFRTGSADFTPAAEATLRELRAQLLVAGGTYVDVHGYTDDVGFAEVNKSLSQRRADAVARWLTASSPASFPEGRLRAFGHGADMPVADNGTAEGRARNRRVEVALRAAD